MPNDPCTPWLAPFCVHIGLPKTATKTLQRRCFPKHRQINFLGSHAPDSAPARKHYRTEADEHLLRPIFESPKSIRRDSATEARNRWCAANGDDARVPLWSREGLSINSRTTRRQRAEAMRCSLGDCTVLITIRNPQKLIESAYFQYLKRHAKWQRNSQRKEPLFLSADRWFRRICQPGRNVGHLDYKHSIDTFANVFGRDSVKVFLFEHLVQDFVQFVAKMFQAIGVDPAQVTEPIRNERENNRWTVEQVARLARIGRNPWRAWQFRNSSPARRRQLLDLDDSRNPCRPGPRPRADFDEGVQQVVADCTRDGNRELVRDYNLPLEEFGYPL